VTLSEGSRLALARLTPGQRATIRNAVHSTPRKAQPVSIWASHDDIKNGVRTYAMGFSNHYPDTKVEKPAEIDLAHIPSYCVPGHRDETDWRSVGEWLRIGMSRRGEWIGCVVLNEKAVKRLRDELSEWLDRPKLSPVPPERTGA